VRNLALGRDIYYRGKTDYRQGVIHDDEPIQIPPKKYLMMGDNVNNSHDSRAWEQHTFELKDGRKIVCEQQQINPGHGDFNKRLQEKLGLPEVPDIGIDGDVDGNEVALFHDQIKEGGESKAPFHFVEEKYIVGKALWIWWPQGRWFHLIR
jgi:hypothetical protein